MGNFSWRREEQPTPVFLPREFHGQRLSIIGNQYLGYSGISLYSKHQCCVPNFLGYAGKRWYLQSSSEVCIWAARAASPPESQSWKCQGDYTLLGQLVANLSVHRWQAQLPCFHTGTNFEMQFMVQSSLLDQEEAGTLSDIVALADSFPFFTLFPPFAYHFPQGEFPG